MLLSVAIIVCLTIAVLLFCMNRKPSKQSTPCPAAEESRGESQPTAEDSPAEDSPTEEQAPEEKPTEEQPETEPAAIEESQPEPKAAADGKPDEEEGEEKGVTQNVQLIAGLHRVFEEEKVFLRPDIHIDDVAKMLLTNRTYITRLMRQEYGLSFIEYVNVARIQYSQSLLYSTDMNLDEIADKSGFQSTSNYCRAFKRYIGTTPLAWKNSLPK